MSLKIKNPFPKYSEIILLTISEINKETNQVSVTSMRDDEAVWINKEEAKQIIDHLKTQFEL